MQKIAFFGVKKESFSTHSRKKSLVECEKTQARAYTDKLTNIYNTHARTHIQTQTHIQTHVHAHTYTHTYPNAHTHKKKHRRKPKTEFFYKFSFSNSSLLKVRRRAIKFLSFLEDEVWTFGATVSVIVILTLNFEMISFWSFLLMFHEHNWPIKF